MANRPRRSKSGGRPDTTIDLGAQRVAPSDARPSDAEMDGRSEIGETTDPIMAEKGQIETMSGDTGTDRSPLKPERDDATIAPAASAGSPAMLGHGVGSASPSVQAGVTPEGDEASAAEQDFAREEGFVAPAAAEVGPDRIHPETGAHEPTGVGGALPRRDLGEFEDDDVAAPHTEAEPAGPDPLATSPYRAAPDEHHRGPGFGSLLGASLLGAAIAVAAGSALLYSGAIPVAATQTPAVNPQQFATAGEVQQIGGDVQTLRGTVEQLQSAQAAGGAGSGMVSSSDFTQLADRVAATERAVQTGDASAGDASTAAASASETANAARDAAGQALQAANAARETADAARTTADSAQQASQSAQQAAANAQTAAGEARTQVEGFATRLASIEEGNRRAGIALSAAALKTAIDRGTPFMAELESFAGASGDPAAVASLRDFAASGVPTAAALNAGWSEAETEILAALRPADPTADMGSQVLSGLRSLVTVRPAGTAVSADAPGPQAAVARMDTAISQGDYAAWIREWEGLPDAARSASESFATRVKARVAADGIIEQTINSAVGASASQG